MRRTIFILIYLCCIGCTSQKTTLSQYKEEVITKIPNKPSLKGQVKRYKERSYTPYLPKAISKGFYFFPME